ncbi:class II fructose-bisphosphate aldolase [Aspergillus ruber CBS 135680]|uniref:Fructose-bisphosphate aldolase n=1 Tax=Aspergillus ruber (strain CBS 135680) TaxID=1388766 RepID=A0A017SAB3_ASPRC|nr:fructose-bisphosphate aldolase [Aspergillus ruber CBS 135680]EYE93887.1 fructose-bisphosphate aldolase [Aspergillus ruber CBS 135680]
MTSNHSAYPASNLTWQILNHANESNYAVGAYNCYNNDGIMAVIRAAERKRSAAIIQLFPWTLHFQGIEFVRYVVSAAHAASVPVAVHLDHCIKLEDVELALTLPFDSIMIDASTFDEEANIRHSKSVVERAQKLNITIEAEMGRIEGGEDGLPTVDMDSVMTRPKDAEIFVQQTGVHFLAPSFGNIHGGYPAGGPEGAWDLVRLTAIGKLVSDSTPLVLHGTHPVSDELFQKAIECGVRKINLNRTVRDDYTKFVAENAGSLELTTLKMQGVEIYAKSIERMMDILGSPGRY